MRNPIPVRFALAAATVLAAMPLAFAGNHPMSSQSSQASQSEEVGTPRRPDVKPFESAKLSLTQAIAESQKEMRGKTLDARFEVWQGKPAYLIRTYSANQIWQTRIDADSGQPLGQPTTVSKSELGPQIQRDITALDNAQTPLDQAIGNAEQQKGGKAIMASVKASRSGTATYDIDLVKNGRLRSAMIDTSTGQMR
ncbi:MAG: PepSY domain-containing protein [Steroidobacteraceae bacterium]